MEQKESKAAMDTPAGIQRYDLLSIEELERSEDGEWVRWEVVAHAVNAHDELIAALQACSFQLGLLCLAHQDFSEASAKAIDASEAVLAKERG
jgi:hypothetical protein